MDEMKEFENDDHADFTSVLKTVKTDELSEEMRILWEAQTQPLQCNSS